MIPVMALAMLGALMGIPALAGAKPLPAYLSAAAAASVIITTVILAILLVRSKQACDTNSRATRILQDREQELTSAVAALHQTRSELTSQLEEVQAHLDSMEVQLDSLDVMVLAIARDQTVLSLNRKGYETLWRGEEDVIGHNWFDTCLPESVRETARKVFDRLMSGDVKRIEPEDMIVLTGTGEEKTLAMHGKLLKDESGQPEAVLYAGIDVSEERVAQSRDRESRAVTARKSRLRALTEFAADIGSQLDGLLRPLLSLPRDVLEKIKEAGPEADPAAAARVVDKLLTLGQAQKTEKTSLILNELVESFLKSEAFVSLMQTNQGVSVNTNLDPDLLPILASEQRIVAILDISVGSSLASMPNGGALTISTRNLYIGENIEQYEVIPQGEYAVLWVSDNGIGMDNARFDTVFDPSLSLGAEGPNLAEVYATVKEHGGYIQIQSEPGAGCELVLCFPVAREEEVKKKKANMLDLPGGSESILVVDDMDQQRLVATRILTRLGYSVTQAASGREAVALFSAAATEQAKRGDDLQESPFQLLVLDMIMEADFDGLEAYREITRLYPRQKCIIVSGFTESERSREALNIGAGQFVSKPYTIDKLASAVRAELDG